MYDKRISLSIQMYVLSTYEYLVLIDLVFIDIRTFALKKLIFRVISFKILIDD